MEELGTSPSSVSRFAASSLQLARPGTPPPSPRPPAVLSAPSSRSSSAELPALALGEC